MQEKIINMVLEERKRLERLTEKPQTDWIPVEERLPDEPETAAGLIDMEDLEEYIVMIEGADEPTCLYYAGDGEWYRDGDLYRVAAWMPLPEPYRPEK